MKLLLLFPNRELHCQNVKGQLGKYLLFSLNICAHPLIGRSYYKSCVLYGRLVTSHIVVCLIKAFAGLLLLAVCCLLLLLLPPMQCATRSHAHDCFFCRRVLPLNKRNSFIHYRMIHLSRIAHKYLQQKNKENHNQIH